MSTFTAGCDVGKVDCVFVLDVSLSIENDANFGLMRNLITQATDFIPIGVDNALFSVILFARHAWINFTIPQYTNRANLIDAVNKISYFDVSELNRTGTNIPEALDLLRIGGQDGRIGLRADAAYRHAIFVTDGRPNTRNLVKAQLGRRLNRTERRQVHQQDEDNTILAARRLLDSGIFDNVFAIGIRGIHNINFKELEHIASRPELEFIVDDFTESAFQAVLKELSEETC